MNVKWAFAITAISIVVIVALLLLLLLSPWILLGVGLALLPSPPKPEVKYGEFEFSLIYEFDGQQKEISDILICEYDGLNIDEGRGKTRKWREDIKNINGYELFAFRDEERKEKDKTYSDICMENIDQYKVVLGLADAEWFMDEPEYKATPEMPYISVYDTEIKYYKYPEESTAFLNEHGFKIISWKCDEPIENTFK